MATTALAPLDVSTATPCLDIPPATWATLSPSTLPPLPAPTPAPPSRLQFSSLPLEIRDLIWEHTLPPPRLFHVRQFHRFGPSLDASENLAQAEDQEEEQEQEQEEQDANSHGHADRATATPPSPRRSIVEDFLQRRLQHQPSAPRTGRRIARFRLSYPAPVATQICAESRRAARRAGFELLPASGNSGPGQPPIRLWFNPRTDIVYIDRSLRTTLVHERGQPEFAVVGFERVRHVAVEWRWVTSNGSVPLGNYADQPMLDLLGQRVASLYAYMPALATLHYILPLVRYQGGIPFGREPAGASALSCDLVDLPSRITIPLESGHRPWGDVRDALVNAIGAESSVQYWLRCFGDRGSYPPNIVGHWLVRHGLDRKYFTPSIREFTW